MQIIEPSDRENGLARMEPGTRSARGFSAPQLEASQPATGRQGGSRSPQARRVAGGRLNSVTLRKAGYQRTGSFSPASTRSPDSDSRVGCNGTEHPGAAPQDQPPRAGYSGTGTGSGAGMAPAGIAPFARSPVILRSMKYIMTRVIAVVQTST